MLNRIVSFTALSLALLTSGAGANKLNPDVSLTLDGHYKQNDTALSHREQGFGLVCCSVNSLIYYQLNSALPESLTS